MEAYVSRLVAWAPGLDSGADWRHWAASPALIEGEDKPPAKAVPAMTRRRLTRWSRMALEVATAVDGDLDPRAPMIFSSRHGDTRRTLALLRDLAAQEPLSPTAFSLSVHNAALGIYTIVRGMSSPSLAVAAGRDTLAQAWLEAQSWLATGTGQVLLVHVDEPLAEFYRPYADEAEMPAALALVLNAQPAAGAVPTRLGFEPARGPAGEASMMREFLAWWYGGDTSLALHGSRLSWWWERDDC